jgi:hypothetical protein
MARPRNTDRESVKSERVSIALTPAIMSGATTLAQIQGTSLNDFVATLIERAVKKNAPVIEKFNAALENALADARAGVNLEGDDDAEN